MSIVTSVELSFQPFSDPPLDGLPRGLFGATKTVVGDGSGGDITIGIVKTGGVPHDMIYQFDACMVSSDNNATNTFSVEIEEGGLYSSNLFLHGSFFNDLNEPLNQLKGYIMYPVKGNSTILTLVTDNDNTFNAMIAIRGRYWERSFLRQTGQTPKFL